MLRSITSLAAALLLGALPAAAQTAAETAPPEAPFAKVSELVTLPDFLPGLGTLYVDPASLPAGPFLGYDHDGKLSATIYMTPIEDLQDGTAYDDLAVGSNTVTSVDVYYNAGHPGVEKPHVHVVLYHDAEAKARLAE
ncbi:hypothetical protein [Paracoccus alkenifer]|uniref:Uncharacterized protein n=1 Tax=Paracoccus alkenifer TaxID=65735 RepID=A0A1H6JA99_9RHOB|nr:hypothetical protein [Paracoccus alkenifer]SEH59173.1 hypothetical protein SAMN04488075_0243 [Paracoccus alkenifer]